MRLERCSATCRPLAHASAIRDLRTGPPEVGSSGCAPSETSVALRALAIVFDRRHPHRAVQHLRRRAPAARRRRGSTSPGSSSPTGCAGNGSGPPGAASPHRGAECGLDLRGRSCSPTTTAQPTSSWSTASSGRAPGTRMALLVHRGAGVRAGRRQRAVGQPLGAPGREALPLAVPLALVGVGLLFRYNLVPFDILHTRPVLWLFALGWAIARARKWPRAPGPLHLGSPDAPGLLRQPPARNHRPCRHSARRLDSGHSSAHSSSPCCGSGCQRLVVHLCHPLGGVSGLQGKPAGTGPCPVHGGRHCLLGRGGKIHERRGARSVTAMAEAAPERVGG